MRISIRDTSEYDVPLYIIAYKLIGLDQIPFCTLIHSFEWVYWNEIILRSPKHPGWLSCCGGLEIGIFSFKRGAGEAGKTSEKKKRRKEILNRWDNSNGSFHLVPTIETSRLFTYKHGKILSWAHLSLGLLADTLCVGLVTGLISLISFASRITTTRASTEKIRCHFVHFILLLPLPSFSLPTWQVPYKIFIFVSHRSSYPLFFFWFNKITFYLDLASRLAPGPVAGMVALLTLLRSDYKQQSPQQPSQQQPQQQGMKKTRSSSGLAATTRSSVVLSGRRVSASNAGDNRDSNSYDSGNDNGGRSSTREVVFPDSFEVLPQPRDLSVIYMGVPHEQQRKFRCRFCGKGYRWKSTMRRHEMVECGGKPPAFQCPECPYKARQRGNLTVHYKRHHQKIGYDEGA